MSEFSDYRISKNIGIGEDLVTKNFMNNFKGVNKRLRPGHKLSSMSKLSNFAGLFDDISSPDGLGQVESNSGSNGFEFL
jgi:hypothetical protein